MHLRQTFDNYIFVLSGPRKELLQMSAGHSKGTGPCPGPRASQLEKNSAVVWTRRNAKQERTGPASAVVWTAGRIIMEKSDTN